MKYRSRTDIIAAMLRSSVPDGVRKSRMMYSAFISYGQVEEYMEFLLGRGLLVQKKDRYYPSEKGLRFLHLWEEIEGLVGPIAVPVPVPTGRSEGPVPTGR